MESSPRSCTWKLGLIVWRIASGKFPPPGKSKLCASGLKEPPLNSSIRNTEIIFFVLEVGVWAAFLNCPMNVQRHSFDKPQGSRYDIQLSTTAMFIIIDDSKTNVLEKQRCLRLPNW